MGMKGAVSIQSDPQVTREGPPPDGRVTIATDRLFTDGRNEVRLLHRGQEYRLRITKQGKLILTK